MQLNRIAIKVVHDRRFRAVATCTACRAMLAQGPEASYEHLAAYALGVSMGVELVSPTDLISAFHRGPACPGGSMQITIEELRPAPRPGGNS